MSGYNAVFLSFCWACGSKKICRKTQTEFSLFSGKFRSILEQSRNQKYSRTLVRCSDGVRQDGLRGPLALATRVATCPGYWLNLVLLILKGSGGVGTFSLWRYKEKWKVVIGAMSSVSDFESIEMHAQR